MCPVIIKLMDVYGTKGVGVHLEKCAYSLATHLATLIGQLEHQRPVLESVFHRLLVSPPPSARLGILDLADRSARPQSEYHHHTYRHIVLWGAPLAQ